MQKVKLGDICEKGGSNIAQKDVENNNGNYPIYGAAGLIKYVDFYQQEKEYIAVVKDGAGIGRAMKLPAKSSVIGTMQYIFPKENVSIDYLFYLLSHLNLAKYFSGATIPHIYFKDYKNEEVNLPSIEEQKAIAEKLDKVSILIEKRKQQLSLLDTLVKSKFVEMFGMIGKDEKGWGIISLGDICFFNPKKSENLLLKNELEVSFVPMTAVSEKGEIDGTDVKTYEQVQKGFTYFVENDVLFAKITPCMENGKGAVACGLKNGIGFGSTEFHVMRPKIGICNPTWLYTVTSFKEFRQEAARNMTGSAGQRRVPVSFLSNYKISLPPLDLQNQFADFAEKTKKTKAKIKQSLAALELLKKSLMQKYFG